MTTPLDRLASLAASRTTRTDRLHEAVGAFLALLRPHVEVGDEVSLNGYTLALVVHRSNVGHSTDWAFSYDDGEACDPEQPIDGEGYLHGDFHCRWRGPSRDDLIALATRASAYVEAFIASHEAAVLALAQAEGNVSGAKAKLLEAQLRTAGGAA
jgi:hypothetical protein